jgi:hypothetical protein
MSLESVHEILLRGLAGTLPRTALHYISSEQALAELKRRTGQDFGSDVESWRAYLRGNGELLHAPAARNAGGDS